jgi:hypothetical protein
MSVLGDDLDGDRQIQETNIRLSEKKRKASTVSLDLTTNENVCSSTDLSSDSFLHEVTRMSTRLSEKKRKSSAVQSKRSSANIKVSLAGVNSKAADRRYTPAKNLEFGISKKKKSCGGAIEKLNNATNKKQNSCEAAFTYSHDLINNDNTKKVLKTGNKQNSCKAAIKYSHDLINNNKNLTMGSTGRML